MGSPCKTNHQTQWHPVIETWEELQKGGDEVVLGAGHLESRMQLGKDCQSGNARVVRSQSKMMLGDDDLDIDQGMIMRLYARN
ncbi:hypothetical protein Acr_00g0064510 [Actinidia rufa]|uniref:Uncharacterized protein n=1 Tax=Actinidia rufa TaxID=165716 RepID=A0A7J0DPJ4_9ERIC|nr:hypothetical protein Acr_00g0064510 [Actinidia rufa]